MKRFAILVVAFLVALTTPAFADRIGVLVDEADGSPDGYALKVRFPNGSVTLADGVATYTGATDASSLQGITVNAPTAGDDGKYLLYDHSGPSYTWDTPGGGGDMTQAVWDGDTDGFIDADAGGTDIDTSSSTGVPYISTGTWSVAATLTHELGGLEADVSAYAGLVKISGGSTSAVAVTANAETILGDTYAQMRGHLDLEAGTDFYSISAADTAMTDAIDAISWGGDLAGTGTDPQVSEAGLDITSMGNLNLIADSAGLGITTGDNLTTISNSVTDDSINEYLSAIDTAVSNILDGSTSFSGLTASGDLDIGAHELRAETFESDVATGTAPFTVASTTVVTNLNADTVDGESASEIVTAARVGGVSDNLDDTDASIEWEDATALEAAGQLTTTATVGAVAFTDLTAGDTYTNFSNNADDDTINELFAALDSTIAGLGAGTGDVQSVGDCTEDACLDGTSDGGTWIKFYDAQGATQLIGGDTSGAVVLTLPTTTGTMVVASEVLTLTNTTEFTPDDDYEPATKKYVDDNVAAGAVVSVGDAVGGAALDGSSDGGTWVKFYDADGATQVIGGDTSGVVTLTLPTTTGTIYASNNDGEIDALAGLTSAADKLPYFTGSGTADVADFTAFGRSIVDDANEATFKATVNLEIGTDVAAFDALLDDISDLSDPGSDKGMMWDDSAGIITWWTPAVNVLQFSGTNLTIADNDAARTAIGLAIGSDVQAYDADLTTYAGITPSANVQSLLAAADYAAMRALLDLEAGTDFYSVSAADAAFEAVDAEIARFDTADTVGADWEWQDNIPISLGNDNDWEIDYNTANGALTFAHTDSTASAVTFDLLDSTQDSTFTITNSDGTYVANLVVEGSITSGPTSGSSFLGLNNNTSDPTSDIVTAGGYAVGFYNGEFTAWEDGTAADFVEANDSVTWAASTTQDFTASGVTLKIPAAAGSNSAIAINNTTERFIMQVAGVEYPFDFDEEPITDGDTFVWDTDHFEFGAAAGGGGGSSWDTIDDPTTNGLVTMDGSGQYTDFVMSADNTEWEFTFSGTHTTESDLFAITQTGTSIGTADLVAITAADSSVTPLHVAHSVASAAINSALFETTGNTASGTEIVQIKSLDNDDDAIQLQLLNGTDDYVNMSIAEAGTFTIDVTSDGTAAVDIVDGLTANSLTSDVNVNVGDNIDLTSSGAIIDFSANSTSLTASAGTLTLEGNLVLGDDDVVLSLGSGGPVTITHDSGTDKLIVNNTIELDDGTGASPGFNFTNSSDETAAFYIADGGEFIFDNVTAGVGSIDLYPAASQHVKIIPNTDGYGLFIADVGANTNVTLTVPDGTTTLTVDGALQLADGNALTVNSVEIVGADGEVNAAAIEDAYVKNDGDTFTGVLQDGTATWTAATQVLDGFASIEADAAEINGTVTLASDETISNATDTQILLAADGGENLAIDLDTATDNEIAVSSPGGATDLSFSSLNLATTGIITGAVNVISDDNARSVTAAEALGTMFVNTGTVDLTLPTAVAGYVVCVYQGQGNTGAITIQPNTGDYLVVDGARETAATDYASTGAADERICVVSVSADDWIVTSVNGTWSE